MEAITCDQLIINDTEIPKEVVESILKKIETISVVQVTKNDIKNIFNSKQYGFSNYENLILPGGGGSIFLRCLGPIDFKGTITKINPSRKLAPGTLSPRGLNISDVDITKLQNLPAGPTLIGDDVVASGTTLNGIYKKLPDIVTPFTEALVLVRRINNDLRKKISINSCIDVEKNGGGYSRINTLSTLLDNQPKAMVIYSLWEKYYGSKFSNEMKDLFDNYTQQGKSK